jgi:hypothetical protein
MADQDWIIAHDATKGRDAYMLECLRCGGVQRFALPISISIYCAAAKVFQQEHAHCQPRDVADQLVQAQMHTAAIGASIGLIHPEK